MLSPALLGSVPAWLISPQTSCDLYFGGNVAWAGGNKSWSDVLATSRASTGYAQWADGHFSSFGSGVPRITDQGLLIEQAGTNLALQSQTLQSATWIPTAGGLGSSPTVTGNFGIAPDGTQTAARLQAALNGGTTVADASQVRQTITVVTATAYTGSFFLKSNTASSYVVEVVDATSGNAVQATVTPTWQRFSFSYTTAGTGASLRVGLQGGRTPANSDSADILVWQGQFELGAFNTSPILTTNASVTRAADMITPAGAAQTAALNAKAARFVTNLVVGGTTPRLIHYSGGAFADFASSSTALISNATNTATATLGSGSYSGLVKTALGMDATSITAIANGGTKASSANAWAGNSGTVYLGSNNGANSLNGYMLRASFGPTKGQFDALTTGSNPQ